MNSSLGRHSIWRSLFRHSGPNDPVCPPEVVRAFVNQVQCASQEFHGHRWRSFRLPVQSNGLSGCPGQRHAKTVIKASGGPQGARKSLTGTNPSHQSQSLKAKGPLRERPFFIPERPSLLGRADRVGRSPGPSFWAVARSAEAMPDLALAARIPAWPSGPGWRLGNGAAAEGLGAGIAVARRQSRRRWGRPGSSAACCRCTCTILMSAWAGGHAGMGLADGKFGGQVGKGGGRQQRGGAGKEEDFLHGVSSLIQREWGRPVIPDAPSLSSR